MSTLLAPSKERTISQGIATTGIGSLPFREVARALEHVFTQYSQPFLPQLPHLTATSPTFAPMLGEILTPRMQQALLQRDTALFERALRDAIATEEAEAQWLRQPATSAFLARLPSTEHAKAQIIGPLTATWMVGQMLAIPLSNELHHPVLWQWIAQLSQTILTMLRRSTHGTLTLIWDDGPLLLRTAPKTQQHYRQILDSLRSMAQVGLHSCAPLDVPAMTHLMPATTLAIDLTVIDIFHAASWHAVCEHLSHDGRFIFGIFDTSNPQLEIAAGIARAQDLVTALDQSLGTAWRAKLAWSGGCGTALHSESFEQQLAAGLRAASMTISTG